jgi:hypothetical protein
MPSLMYPLDLRFKLVAFSPQIYVKDAAGNEQMFIHQKVFKLKEDILVFNSSKKERVIFRIRADRVIDFSSTYRFFMGDTQENPFGAIKRKGMRSFWRATYYVEYGSQITHHVKEDNPWVKVWDSLLGEVGGGLLTGYFFNPSYTLYRGENREDESQPIMRLSKKKSFTERSYSIELLDPSISNEEEVLSVLSMMMMIQLERYRG